MLQTIEQAKQQMAEARQAADKSKSDSSVPVVEINEVCNREYIIQNTLIKIIHFFIYDSRDSY